MALVAGIVALALALAPGPQAALAPILTHDVAVSEGVAWTGRTGRLVTLDLADPARPEPLGELALAGTPRRVRLDGSRALLAAGATGLLVVDAGDPADPRLVARYDPPGAVLDAIGRGRWAWLATRRHGLEVVDLERPERPLRVASLGARDEALALALSGNLLAVAEEEAGVRLVDVSRPAHPRELELLDEDCTARDVAFAGDWLVAACGKAGVAAWRLPERGHPAGRPARRWALGTTATAVTALGARVVVSAGPAGLVLLEPERDEPVGRIELPGRLPAGRIGLAGSIALVAVDRWDLAVVDLTDPAAPEVLYPRERRLRITFP